MRQDVAGKLALLLLTLGMMAICGRMCNAQLSRLAVVDDRPALIAPVGNAPGLVHEAIVIDELRANQRAIHQGLQDLPRPNPPVGFRFLDQLYGLLPWPAPSLRKGCPTCRAIPPRNRPTMVGAHAPRHQAADADSPHFVASGRLRQRRIGLPAPSATLHSIANAPGCINTNTSSRSGSYHAHRWLGSETTAVA